MTTSYQDLLSATFQEYVCAQQKAERARSDMHCIIGSLPDGEVPTSYTSKPTVACSLSNGHSETPTLRSLPESSRDSRAKRPVVVPLQPVVADPEPLPEAPEPRAEISLKKTRGKRTSESDLRKAVKLFVDSMNTDSPLTQKQAEKAAGIPQGALSKGKGKEILADCMKDVSRISPRIAVPAGVRKKTV